jgi:hypothetical protein
VGWAEQSEAQHPDHNRRSHFTIGAVTLGFVPQPNLTHIVGLNRVGWAEQGEAQRKAANMLAFALLSPTYGYVMVTPWLW